MVSLQHELVATLTLAQDRLTGETLQQDQK
jgi:hypothetical protein